MYLHLACEHTTLKVFQIVDDFPSETTFSIFFMTWALPIATE